MAKKAAEPGAGHMLEPGRNCWRIERAQRAALIVDAADYFRIVRQAMLKAKSQILLIGWDFDTRINLDTGEQDEAPTELGAFLSWLPKRTPGVQIYILKWNYGAIGLLGRGTTAFRIARWAASKSIHFKLDAAHPVGASHHQKIVVIDDRLAFCGGIDMTAERWDTRAHLDHDKGRKRPTTHRAYAPWHDATMAVDGPAAKAFGELSRMRWEVAGGEPITPPPRSSHQPWPSLLKPMFKEVDVAISRTRAAFKDAPAVREIEKLFLDQIGQAKRFLYAENQYFASRVIAEAIARRLAEPDGPEFVIVNPRTGRGWLDDEAMTPARTKLLQQVEKADTHGRFRIYSPVTAEGEDIYVHSKITIIDDELIRVGSANFNNRSMGLDSECDLTIDTSLQVNRGGAAAVGSILDDLLAEHLGVPAAEVRKQFEKRGSLISAIEALRSSRRSLVHLPVKEPNPLETALAEAETLDPESGGDEFEPVARPGLIRGLRRRVRA